ncbi:MAG: flagellar protein FlgN [Candidatus Pristimantibacillus sp.]
MAFRELVQSLEEMLMLYQTLYELGLKKKDQIIKNEMNEMTASLSKESKLLKLMNENENARRAIVIQIQRDLGFRPRLHVTLSDISKMVTNPDDKQEITKLQQELNVVVTNLRKLNELNQQLIQQSIEFVEFSLDTMFGAPDEEVVYKNPALQPQGSKRTGLFDTRA